MELKRVIKLETGIGSFRSVDHEEIESIEDIINHLQDALDHGATHVKWDTPEYSEYGHMICIKIEMESEEDFQKRVVAHENKEKIEAEQLESRERNTLAVLKAKYD